MSYRLILMWSLIGILFSMALFTVVVDFILQSVILLFIGLLVSIIHVVVNLCVFETQKSGDVHFWMLIIHGIYGIGGLLGPMLLSFFWNSKLLHYRIAFWAIGSIFLRLEITRGRRKVAQVDTKSLMP